MGLGQSEMFSEVGDSPLSSSKKCKYYNIQLSLMHFVNILHLFYFHLSCTLSSLLYFCLYSSNTLTLRTLVTWRPWSRLRPTRLSTSMALNLLTSEEDQEQEGIVTGGHESGQPAEEGKRLGRYSGYSPVQAQCPSLGSCCLWILYPSNTRCDVKAQLSRSQECHKCRAGPIPRQLY